MGEMLCDKCGDMEWSDLAIPAPDGILCLKCAREVLEHKERVILRLYQVYVRACERDYSDQPVTLEEIEEWVTDDERESEQ
jgi:hypothetical protein